MADASYGLTRQIHLEVHMNANEASWDRVARVILGIGLIAIGLLAIDNGWRWALAAVGGIFLVTGLAGWCPIYAVIGKGTKNESRDGGVTV